MKARFIIASVVTGIWAANYIVSFFEKSYQPHLEVNGIMAIVVGYFFGEWIRTERKNGKRNGDSK